MIPAPGAPLPRLRLAALEAMAFDGLTKGLPYGAAGITPAGVGGRGWRLLEGDLPFPAAVIRSAVLRANSRWMAAFTEANGLRIAPHGKTTMAPQLFDLQAADGAWAITAATAQQVAVCHRFGVARVILANQPVGRQALAQLFSVLSGSGRIELYCLADSPEGVAALAAAATAAPPPADNPLRVLVEVGVAGGRTGARDRAAALAVAQAVAAAPGLALAGVECFEGILPDAPAVDRLVDEVVAVARAVDAAGLVAADRPLVLTAGGSSFFDRVGERLGAAGFDRPVLRVLRSGCYLTHDTMGYARAFARIRAETRLRLPPGGLEPALEVWALVQSRPEPGRAILTMGKRDVGHDAGLPQLVRWFRPGMTAPAALPEGHVTVALNDQHAHMTLPAGSPLAFGDMVGFGIGHPCTTFERWQLIWLVNEQWEVESALRTFF
ncbi:MAG: alanine racemase [Rhodobacteraceae bacterium]|nr:alanine racemase [Paracoccaceae bacterium]